ncbi:MAG: hypothetical protein AAF652_19405, partial [Cyanobacteria bacterium P01_C01_bin.72]
TISEGVPQGHNISFRTGKAQPHSGQIALSELDAKHRPYALLAFKKTQKTKFFSWTINKISSLKNVFKGF